MSAPVNNYTFDDLQIDIFDLHRLLISTYSVIHEMPYERDGKRDEELDQVASLLRIARDFSGRISEATDKHHRSIRGVASTPVTSEIMVLFGRWDDLRDRSNEPGLDEEDVLRRCNETDEVMRQLLVLPAKSAADLAAKLMCFTHYGDYSLDQFAGGERLMFEMAALVGRSEKLADKFLLAAQGGKHNG